MKKAEKSHKLPVFGARSFVEEETDGDRVIFINHQKFVKRTVDDVTAYFADGTTAGAARQHLEAMKPKVIHKAIHAKHTELTGEGMEKGEIQGIRIVKHEKPAKKEPKK